MADTVTPIEKKRAERRVDIRGVAVWPELVGCLLCLSAAWPHVAGYFEFMRWVVPVAAIVLIVMSVLVRMPGWIAGLAPIAVLWNPVAPIYLTRSAWIPLDLMAFGFFVVYFWFVTLPVFRPDAEADAH